MRHKAAPAQVAPEVDPDTGTFEAIVSVFNNKDLGGDIVRPGAFTKSLDVWGESGDPIPIYWSHRMDDPSMNIGAVEEARELTAGDKAIPEWANTHVKENGGLYVKGRLDDFGLGKHVAHLMKTRRVKQFSFSYDVISEHKSKSGDANELTELWLHEVGPTPLGMNPLTELLAAKQRPPQPDPEVEAKRRAAALFSCRASIEIARWHAELAD
jgi:Escherichia/Staphylococcus phage prohead protease